MKIFPFTAIVGQDDMKLCLILNVIDPTIGGVLIMGEKGTACRVSVHIFSRAESHRNTVAENEI